MTIVEQFVEKYNLRQKKYIDLSFVGDAYDYSTFELAVADVNENTTTNALASGTGSVRVFKGEDITVIRLLQDIKLTTQTIIKNNAIVDFNGFTISKAEDYTSTNFLGARWVEGKEIGVVFYARNGGNIRTTNVAATVVFICEYSALIGISINSNYDSSYSVTTSPLPIRIGNYTEDGAVIQKVIIEDCRVDASAVGETTVSKPLYGVYDYNYKATELIMSNTKITINNEVFDTAYPHIVHNAKEKIDNIFKLINCHFVYNSSVSTLSIGVEVKGGHLTMIDCYIKTESSVTFTCGLTTGAATAYIRNSDIIALSPNLQDSSAIGIMSSGICYLHNTNVFGVASGIQNKGTLYVNGGYLRAPGHGGLYNSDNAENTGAKAYLYGVTLARAIDELQEFGVTCSNSNGATYNAYGCYTWFDNCTFKGARVVCKYATDETDDTDRGATVYISNSYSELGYRCDQDTVLTLGTGVTGSTNITGVGTVNYTEDDFSELVKVDVPSEFYGTIADYLKDLNRARIDLANLVGTNEIATVNTLTDKVYSTTDALSKKPNVVRGFFTPEEDTTTFSVDGLPFTPKTLFLGNAELCTSNITRAFLQIMHTKGVGGCVSLTATTIALSASSWVKWSDYGVSYDSSASSTAVLKNGLFKGGYTYEYLIIGEDAE